MKAKKQKLFLILRKTFVLRPFFAPIRPLYSPLDLLPVRKKLALYMGKIGAVAFLRNNKSTIDIFWYPCYNTYKLSLS